MAARSRRGVTAATLIVLATSGCGGDHSNPAEATAGPKTTVVVGNGAYRPAHVQVPVGGRVTFVGGSSELNTAETGGVGPFELDSEKLDRQNRFDTHIVQRGEALSVEFDTPGTYKFHSSLNYGMKGTVTVVER
ncbi:MAG TPA: cupredoxin domain-containing protein [Thermoleophilaceae bacterium]|nr:cupredoxin domain-containing protein [Thermoleophilaceae bacterium]